MIVVIIINVIIYTHTSYIHTYINIFTLDYIQTQIHSRLISLRVKRRKIKERTNEHTHTHTHAKQQQQQNNNNKQTNTHTHTKTHTHTHT